MKLYFETKIDNNFEIIKKHFNRDLFLALKPPGVNIELERFDGCTKGDEVHLKIQSPVLTQHWISHITSNSSTPDEWSFVDEGFELPWPLKYWKHIHVVKKLNENQSLIIDDITFSSSSFIFDLPLKPLLWLSFAVRPKRYKKFFMDKV